MEEKGLYLLGGLVLLVLVATGALLAVLDGGERAASAPAAVPAAEAPRVPAAPRAAARDPAPAAAAAVCTPAGAPQPIEADVRESSGVAVSRAHPGIFWTHNDSGEPVLYAVDGRGRSVGRVRVAGAAVEDWEDVALAPCPAGGDCLFVADIGDNAARRPHVTVYRIPEPAPGAAASAPATALRLRYPDGAQDAEAMFVLDGAVHVVTKGESGPIALYRAPAGAGGEATLERIRELSPDRVGRPERITGAAARADGRWVVLRTLREAAFYPAGELAGGGAAAPRRVDLRELDEAQGEGIGFGPDGEVLVTSEGGGKNRRATFARLSCTLP
jgi:hypothetical protein